MDKSTSTLSSKPHHGMIWTAVSPFIEFGGTTLPPPTPNFQALGSSLVGPCRTLSLAAAVPTTLVPV